MGVEVGFKGAVDLLDFGALENVFLRTLLGIWFGELESVLFLWHGRIFHPRASYCHTSVSFEIFENWIEILGIFDRLWFFFDDPVKQCPPKLFSPTVTKSF